MGSLEGKILKIGTVFQKRLNTIGVEIDINFENSILGS